MALRRAKRSSPRCSQLGACYPPETKPSYTSLVLARSSKGSGLIRPSLGSQLPSLLSGDGRFDRLIWATKPQTSRIDLAVQLSPVIAGDESGRVLLDALPDPRQPTGSPAMRYQPHRRRQGESSPATGRRHPSSRYPHTQNRRGGGLDHPKISNFRLITRVPLLTFWKAQPHISGEAPLPPQSGDTRECKVICVIY